MLLMRGRCAFLGLGGVTLTMTLTMTIIAIIFTTITRWEVAIGSTVPAQTVTTPTAAAVGIGRFLCLCTRGVCRAGHRGLDGAAIYRLHDFQSFRAVGTRLVTISSASAATATAATLTVCVASLCAR